jgi:DNA (cytosine-5)-methyltransferase 1
MIIDAIYNNREPRVTEISPTLRADRQGLCVGGDIKVIGNYSPSGHEASRVLDPNGIAPTVMENHGTVNAVAIDMTVNKPAITDNVRCLKARYTADITNRSGDNSGVLVKENVFDIYNNKMRTDGCTGTLTTNGNTSVTKCGTFGVFHNTRIRKLTPRECWRLQGFPDEYFDKAVAAGVSNSQLYRQAGNAVSVPVAQAIGERLREIELMEGQT